MRWEMRPARFIAASFAVAAAVGCITVNINFPAREVDRAAEVIVGEARPEPGTAEDGVGGSGTTGADGMASPPAVPDPAPTTAPPRDSSGKEPPSGAFGPVRFVSMAMMAAPAEGGEPDIKINIETPAIKAIRESLVKRFEKLRPFYDKEAVGESREGLLATRVEEGLSLKEKRDLKGLVEAENGDRQNLYRAIVKANDLGEENLKRVQALFAKTWIAKSRPGWWVQDEEGKWVKKADPKKKDGKKVEKD